MTEPNTQTTPALVAAERIRSRSILLALILLAACGAGPSLLLWLAQFGQQPPPSLPLPAILLFGALFTGPLFDLLGGLRGRPRQAVLLLGALLGTAAALLLAQLAGGDWRHLLAPMSAVLSTLLLGLLPSRLGAMLSAMGVYTVCILLANYTLDSFLPLGNFFLVNVGTLFFGITFTQRDRVHRFGRRAVYSMILFAAVANVALSAALDTPLRYVAVSFLAIVLAETADTEIYQRLLNRRWLTRVASSNAVSAPLDTLIFTLLAFWGEPFATREWLVQVTVTDVLVKYASGMLAALGMIALLRSAMRPLLGQKATA